MNLNPAQLVRDLPDYPQPDQAAPQPRPAPVAGELPKVESADTFAQRPSGPAMQQVVKVHSDNSTEPPILVYEFVDSRSDSVIVQIPSEQMLSLVQDIRQRLHRTMTEKAAPQARSGEKE